ncbi:hypothetical protein BKH41_08430 [Helicobacter sp. 12S02232-10]|uniref:hypothetical protein n=1 Tax=Helicobacter sp. 12S02232-10 TaxID=1476197 RepID=UPI000BA78043|nr:hypothetical protein [Helicobacter sp. 12S02232-10]PAF46885.1 hypothetical protein BKH41_08430 [Helicobacter sp. 12S02232-10]
MFYQFHASFNTPQYFLDPIEFKKRLKSKEIYHLKQDLKLNQKEYENLLKRTKQNENDFIAYDHEFFRLAFRGIASDTNERTSIFSLLPKNIGCGSSVWSSIPKHYIPLGDSISIERVSYLRLLFALGIFNSLVMDFLVRQMVQINDVFSELSNMFEIQKEHIPPTPKLYDQLKAQNDIAIAKLYGISYKEFCHLLKSFQVLTNKKPQYIALIISPQLWE